MGAKGGAEVWPSELRCCGEPRVPRKRSTLKNRSMIQLTRTAMTA